MNFPGAASRFTLPVRLSHSLEFFYSQNWMCCVELPSRANTARRKTRASAGTSSSRPLFHPFRSPATQLHRSAIRMPQYAQSFAQKALPTQDWQSIKLPPYIRAVATSIARIRTLLGPLGGLYAVNSMLLVVHASATFTCGSRQSHLSTE